MKKFIIVSAVVLLMTPSLSYAAIYKINTHNKGRGRGYYQHTQTPRERYRKYHGRKPIKHEPVVMVKKYFGYSPGIVRFISVPERPYRYYTYRKFGHRAYRYVRHGGASYSPCQCH